MHVSRWEGEVEEDGKREGEIGKEGGSGRK